MPEEDNLGLISLKRERKVLGVKVSIVNSIVDKSIISTLDNGYVFPLYLYTQNLDGSVQRGVNVDRDLLQQFAQGVELAFSEVSNNPDSPAPPPNGERLGGGRNPTPNREFENTENSEPLPNPPPLGEGTQCFTPENLLDYIYAVLHSPNYRKKYAEFLKIDFPRVPFPNSAEHFWQLVEQGEQLRLWHLLKHPDLSDFSQFITTYPVAGDNEITRKMTKNSIGYEATNEAHGKIWINDEQYFDKVPKTTWEFYIGGYQPEQKWLKDRHGRTLSYDDIIHYQRMILAMNKTEEIMQKIAQIY